MPKGILPTFLTIFILCQTVTSYLLYETQIILQVNYSGKVNGLFNVFLHYSCLLIADPEKC